MNEVILFPEYEELKTKVESLRTELSEKLFYKDELRLVVCKNIETAYMLQLGALEYKVYEAQCEALRLRRKQELIQVKKNRQEKIYIPEIEAVLNKEFEEYQKKLDQQIEKMNDAIDRSKGRMLTDEESKRIKKIYHKVVKVLHPDLNPEITDVQIALFENATSAYANGDLPTLEIIYEMVGEHEPIHKEENAMQKLIREKDRLKGLIKTVEESIDHIKAEYPYNVKEIVEDEEKLNEHRRALEMMLQQYKDMIEDYTHIIEGMVK